jgi:hypothetical protein
MNYRSISLFILLVVCIAAAVPLPAQADSLADLKANARVVWDGETGIPDHVFLPGFLQSLSMRYQGDPGRYASYINSRLELDDFEHAQQIVAVLDDVAQAITRESVRVKRDLVCPKGRPGPSGQDLFLALDAVDDARPELGRRYLGVLREELGEDVFARLVALMDRRKQTSTIVHVDHSKAHEDKNPDLMRQSICARIDSAED